jgi:hypothetical protein
MIWAGLFFLATGCGGGGGGVSVGNSRPTHLEGVVRQDPVENSDEASSRQVHLVPVSFQIKGLEPADEPAPYWSIPTQTKVPLLITEADAMIDSLAFRPAEPIDCAAYATAATTWSGRVGVCEADAIAFFGPFALNMISGESTPPISSLALPEGEYSAVLLRLANATGQPSLRLRGIYQDSQSRDVLLRPELPSEIGFTSDELSIFGADEASLAVKISVTDWFMGTENEIVRCRINSHNQAEAAGEVNADEVSSGDSDRRCDAAEALLQSNLIPASRLTALP